MNGWALLGSGVLLALGVPLGVIVAARALIRRRRNGPTPPPRHARPDG